jgi:hypothetical protein
MMIRISKIHYDYLHYLFNTRSEQSLEAFEEEINTRSKFDPLLKEIIDQYFHSFPRNCFQFICQNINCSTEVSATIKIIAATTESNIHFSELLLDSEIDDHIHSAFDLRQICDASDVSFEIIDRAYIYKRTLISYDQYISKLNDIRDEIEPI